jgi:hypothetical protein
MFHSEPGFSNKLLTSRILVASLATLFISIAVWAIRKSAVTSDVGMYEEARRNLFQGLEWIWLVLFFAPAVYIGTARIRTAVLCGVFAYGVGTLIGWCAAELGSVLSDPLLRPGLWSMLVQGFGLGAVAGGLLVGVVRLCRYFTPRWTGRR